jgi:hypothetical protein
MFAQSMDPSLNLEACKNGWASCDRSRLTQMEAAEVAELRSVVDKIERP